MKSRKQIKTSQLSEIIRASEKTGSSKEWLIMQPVRGQIRFAMSLSVGASVFGLLAMGLLALTIKRLLEFPHEWPVQLMSGAVVSTIAAFVLRKSSFDQSHYAAFRLEKILRTDLSEHLAKVSMGSIQKIGTGALAKVIYDDVKALHVFVADSTPLYARAYVAPVISFLLLFLLDWRLALTATGVMVFGFGGLSLAMRNRTEMVRLYNEARESVNASIIEYVQAMPVVRTFDSGKATFGRYQKALENYLEMLARWYRENGFPARFSFALLNPMPTLAVLLWMGVWLLWRDSLSLVHWLAVLLVGAGMAESMMPVMMLKHMIDKVKLSITRIYEVMDIPELPAPAVSRTASFPEGAVVRFENVGFRYNSADADALVDISFTVPEGSVTALVGPSGAGKSTVARLIPRFWDVSTGRILVGGTDVRELPSEALMGQVAFVFQDTFLFADTIAGNIRVGMPDIGMDAVVAAATAAQAHDFIQALPNGYDTMVGERGIFLSGGQRQRITIARAILQNRPILVLDEATAFADPENEAALVAALSELMKGKTVIIVAHRLATIRSADQILVFDKGRLVEKGRHEDLVDAGGTYARLWSSYEKAQIWALGGRAECGNN